MNKRLVGLALFFVFSVSFANKVSCIDSLPVTSPGFCQSMKTSAECHCNNTGVPKMFCNNMKSLYSRMIGMFGSLERACKFQHDAPTQLCMDDWNCYINGGKDSSGQLCSSTGNACE